MARYNDKNVITGSVTVLWNGFAAPSKNDDGSVVHNLTVAIPLDAPELLELRQICDEALKSNSVFKGVLPYGASEPFRPIDKEKITEPHLQNCSTFNAKTRQGVKQVYDIKGARLDPVVAIPQLYPGSLIQVFVHAYCVSDAGKKRGIYFGLDGVKIVDSTTPLLKVASGASNMAEKVFGATTPSPIMTAKAGGLKFEDFLKVGWTKEMMQKEGYIA